MNYNSTLKLKFIGTRDLPGYISLRIKEVFERITLSAFEEEFGLQIEIEWDPGRSLCFISRNVLDIFNDEPEELHNFLLDLFKDAAGRVSQELGQNREISGERQIYKAYLKKDNLSEEEEDEDEEEDKDPEEDGALEGDGFLKGDGFLEGDDFLEELLGEENEEEDGEEDGEEDEEEDEEEK